MLNVGQLQPCYTARMSNGREMFLDYTSTELESTAQSTSVQRLVFRIC